MVPLFAYVYFDLELIIGIGIFEVELELIFVNGMELELI